MCIEQQYQEVVTNLTAVLKERNIPWATVSLARAHFGLGNISIAENLLQELLKNNQNNVEALDLLAKIQFHAEQFDQAKKTLSKSIDLSPYSMTRHQTMIEIAVKDNDLNLVKESYAQLLILSRRSVHAGTDNLLNYTRSIIDMAELCEETKEYTKLQNELNTALYRAKQEEGRNLDYQFSTIEGVVQAQFQSAKGDLLVSKKTLMSAIHSFCDEDDNWQLPPDLIADACITLANANDFELVDKFAKELPTDSLLTTRIKEKLGQDDIAEQQTQFKQITRLGIQAYSEGNNSEALELFNDALKLSPVSSGAILNVLQAQIKLMQSHKKYAKALMTECKDSLRALNGMKISMAHQKRLDKLKIEYNELAKKS